ncbi:SDR family NAD(P)-dependent oxidoreductase [Paenarthrobacter sp. NPDC057981]|uniref:SDR family NAD(P)-dependent oxidoreductase n=1 Tax=Paenarthrobacter sp. NPDC057981 TaxID=3346297 RepID=UPI0036DA5F3B
MKDFQGLVAIVTGGASGIGAATAQLLSDRGASVVVIDRSISEPTEGIHGIVCDITSTEDVTSAVEEVISTFGRLDVLINNAGIGASGDVAANTDEEWHRVLDVNVVGTARMSRAALPYLSRSPHAAVVNTCSTIAFVGVPNRALYSASKGAIAALTLSMAADHVGTGIRVNAVAPGTADTPWVNRLLDEAADPNQAAEALRRRQPLGRLVTSDEVARSIAFLASPASGSTTGTVLTVDGGMASLRTPTVS